MPEGEALLIAALSGRALAEAARASGYIPLVADFFGDADMLQVAARSVVLAGDFRDGFQLEPLLVALHGLSRPSKVKGLVCGTGFEHRPELLAELARHWPLLGCGAEIVALVKHPLHFSALCAQAGVAHPETRLEAPDDAEGWLRKQWGGSGGGHVDAISAPGQSPNRKQDMDRVRPPPCGGADACHAPGGGGLYREGTAGSENRAIIPPSATPARRCAPTSPLGGARARAYSFQRFAPGMPVSLLMLANGRRAMVLGHSAQWADPAPGQPYRYGGALRPAAIDPALNQLLEQSAARIVALTASCGSGLRGLISFDFLVTETGFTLLEINPRPGATLDVFTHPGLMQAHINACAGTLPVAPLAFDGAQAAAIVYCDSPMQVPAQPDWAPCVKDRPNLTSPLQIGQPICTVVTQAASPDSARRLLEQRIHHLRSTLTNNAASGEMPE